MYLQIPEKGVLKLYMKRRGLYGLGSIMRVSIDIEVVLGGGGHSVG